MSMSMTMSTAPGGKVRWDFEMGKVDTSLVLLIHTAREGKGKGKERKGCLSRTVR